MCYKQWNKSQERKTKESKKKKKSYNYFFIRWGSSLVAIVLDLASLSLGFSTTLAWETTSLIVKVSSDWASLAGGRPFLPLPTPVEVPASKVRSWMLGTYSGKGKGRAVEEGSAGISLMCSGKYTFFAFLNSKSAKTPAILRASFQVIVQ